MYPSESQHLQALIVVCVEDTTEQRQKRWNEIIETNDITVCAVLMFSVVRVQLFYYFVLFLCKEDKGSAKPFKFGMVSFVLYVDFYAPDLYSLWSGQSPGFRLMKHLPSCVLEPTMSHCCLCHSQHYILLTEYI